LRPAPNQEGARRLTHRTGALGIGGVGQVVDDADHDLVPTRGTMEQQWIPHRALFRLLHRFRASPAAIGVAVRKAQTDIGVAVVASRAPAGRA
jgi:hypothetical protein